MTSALTTSFLLVVAACNCLGQNSPNITTKPTAKEVTTCSVHLGTSLILLAHSAQSTSEDPVHVIQGYFEEKEGEAGG